jgi:hypothetical protein
VNIIFAIQGVPIGKARPRVLRSGHVYTPAKSVAYECQVQLAATVAKPTSLLQAEAIVAELHRRAQAQLREAAQLERWRQARFGKKAVRPPNDPAA